MAGTVHRWSGRRCAKIGALFLTALVVLGLLVSLAGPRVSDAAGPLGLVRSVSLGARAHDIAIVGTLAYVARHRPGDSRSHGPRVSR
jgi:hypothetical protein